MQARREAQARQRAASREGAAIKKGEVMRKISRSAKTGRFVTAKYAKPHPSTTVTETRKPVPKAK